MPFNGIHNLRSANESVKLEMWQLQEIERCTKDPIYFIRHYVYINTKDEGTQLMKTYPFIKLVISECERPNNAV